MHHQSEAHTLNSKYNLRMWDAAAAAAHSWQIQEQPTHNPTQPPTKACQLVNVAVVVIVPIARHA